MEYGIVLYEANKVWRVLHIAMCPVYTDRTLSIYSERNAVVLRSDVFLRKRKCSTKRPGENGFAGPRLPY